MAKRGEISETVDNLLKIAMAGGVLSVGLFAPNALQALDKPMKLYFRKMDARQREREIRRALTYMRSQKLVTGSYEHGLQITKRGKARLEKSNLDNIKIAVPKKWDKKWRLVFFDIPEEKKTGRDALTRKLKELGFRQLQKSAWIYPYPCRQEIETVCTQYQVDEYITYIETSYIDKQQKLKKLFKV